MRPFPGVEVPTLLARGIHEGDGESEGSVLFVLPETINTMNSSAAGQVVGPGACLCCQLVKVPWTNSDTSC